MSRLTSRITWANPWVMGLVNLVPKPRDVAGIWRKLGCSLKDSLVESYARRHVAA